MERWSGKVAVVTGASSGIGLETAKALLKNGLIVVGLARRVEKMQIQLGSLPEAKGKFYAIKCDVSNDNDVIKAFEWIKCNVGKVQVLVNNAGLLREGKLTETSNEILRTILNVNVMGTVYCTKEALKIIQENNLEGHIINMNSVVGHRINIPLDLHMNVYPASKYAINGFTESLIREVMGGKIRVTSISPGPVQTEIALKFDKIPCLDAVDIANNIIYILGTPQNVQIKEFTVFPVGNVY